MFTCLTLQSDVIVGLGTHDTRVAMETAMLWFEGWADVIVFTGRSGNLTKGELHTLMITMSGIVFTHIIIVKQLLFSFLPGRWNRSEAEVFRDIAISMGVPSCKIYIETESRNTGENIRFTHDLLKKRNKVPHRIILVQKPHMGKRTAATFWKQWPQSNTPIVSLVVRTLRITLERYPNNDVGDLGDVISVMMGYLQRLPLYYKFGFQTHVHIPSDIWDSFLFLQKTGLYNSHFIS